MNLKKPVFLPILCPFSQFLGQKTFIQKIELCHAQLHEFLNPRQNLERNNNPIPRKFPEGGRKGRWKDVKTLFHRTILVTALEIRKIGWQQKIAVVYVLLDGNSAAKISPCVFCYFNH